MPLYHFLIHDGVHQIAPTAEDLAGIEVARERAMGLLADLLRWSPASIWAGNDVRVEVSNADGLLLFQLFAFASISSAGAVAGSGA